MEILRLKKEISEGILKGFYVFYGEEHYILSQFVEKIVKASGKKPRYIDSVGGVTRYLNNKNVFGESYVYICFEDKELLSDESSWQVLRQNKGNHIVIVKYVNLDKRSKFFKENGDFIVEFEKLGPDILLRYAIKDFSLSESKAIKLVNRSNENYGLMRLNGQKIELLSKIMGVNSDRAFDICVSDGLIPISSANLAPDFVSCVIYKDIEKAFFFKGLLESSGDSILQVLALLYSNIRTIFLIQSCKKGVDVSQKTGLSPGLVMNCKDKCGIYNLETLMYGLTLIKSLETGLKNGLFDEGTALDNFLVSFFFKEVYGGRNA